MRHTLVVSICQTMLTERKRRNDQGYKQNRFDDSAIEHVHGRSYGTYLL